MLFKKHIEISAKIEWSREKEMKQRKTKNEENSAEKPNIWNLNKIIVLNFFLFLHTIQCCGNLWHSNVNFWIVLWAQIHVRPPPLWIAFAWNSWNLNTDAFCSHQWRWHIYHKHWTKLKLKIYLMIWSHFFRPLFLICVCAFAFFALISCLRYFVK